MKRNYIIALAVILLIIIISFLRLSSAKTALPPSQPSPLPENPTVAATTTVTTTTVATSTKPMPPKAVAKKCYVGGCSGEICTDQKDVASNCMYREEYACYKKTTCEVQKDGECGWTETPELKMCLSAAQTGQVQPQ